MYPISPCDKVGKVEKQIKQTINAHSTTPNGTRKVKLRSPSDSGTIAPHNTPDTPILSGTIPPDNSPDSIPTDPVPAEMPLECFHNLIQLLSDDGLMTDHLALPNHMLPLSKHDKVDMDSYPSFNDYDMAISHDSSTDSDSERPIVSSLAHHKKRKQSVSDTSEEIHIKEEQHPKSSNSSSNNNSFHNSTHKGLMDPDTHPPPPPAPPPVVHSKGYNYMGICRLHPHAPHRRIDIKYVPLRELGFALLYFTGSMEFNREMRRVAHTRGVMLNQHVCIYLCICLCIYTI